MRANRIMAVSPSATGRSFSGPQVGYQHGKDVFYRKASPKIGMVDVSLDDWEKVGYPMENRGEGFDQIGNSFCNLMMRALSKPL